jgi:KaiC/GvpD/RAD55 family RecA-like ATPase
LSGAGNELNRVEDQNKSGGSGSSSRSPLLPGIDLPVQNTNSKILLLHGPSGVGKTLYCRQFLREGLIKGHRCVFVSTALSKRQFNGLFSNMDDRKPVVDPIEFINPRDDDNGDVPLSHHNHKVISGKKLVAAILSDIIRILETTTRNDRKTSSSSTLSNIDGNIRNKAVRLVVDPLTHMLLHATIT